MFEGTVPDSRVGIIHPDHVVVARRVAIPAPTITEQAIMKLVGAVRDLDVAPVAIARTYLLRRIDIIAIGVPTVGIIS